MHEPLAGIPGEVFFLDLQLVGFGGEFLSANRYVFGRASNLAPLLHGASTQLAGSFSGEKLTVTNCGETAGMFVWLEDPRDLTAPGYVYFDDNYFCLLPGESHTVSVAWQDVPAAERRLEVSGWNTNQLIFPNGES
jgi:beta-mannosidase